jgi:TPR repeat protein
MLLLALVLGIYTYRQELGQALIWVGEFISGSHASQPPPQKAASEQTGQSTEGASSTPADATASDGNPVHSQATTEKTQANDSRTLQKEKRAEGAAAGNATQTPAATPAKPKYTVQGSTAANGPAPSSEVAEPTPDAGQGEYQQAMQILRGKNSTYGVAEAVKLLWAAVEKGNPSAELALADMYWHGKGVARNCDQTRILLTAASRKGSAEAQRLLEEFQQEGCE